MENPDLSEEAISSMSYNMLIKVAKKLNIYNKRMKKVLLIKKIVSAVRGKEENNENIDPEDSTVFKSFDDSIISKPELIKPAIERRSTFNVESAGALGSLPEEPQMVEGRRLTFTKTSLSPPGISSGGLCSLAEEPETEGGRRLTFTKTSLNSEEERVSTKEDNKQRTPKDKKVSNLESRLKTPPVAKQVVKTPRQSTLASTSRNAALLPSIVPKTPRGVAKTPSSSVPTSRSTFLPNTISKTPRGVAKTPKSSATISRSSLLSAAKKSSVKKVPNFAEIHARQFLKMESLVEAKERQAKRALQLFSPNNKRTRSSIPVFVGKPKSTGGGVLGNVEEEKSRGVEDSFKKTTRTSIKRIPLKAPHQTSVAKTREANCSIIKGVRANKRFLLQMQARNISIA